MSVGEHTLLMDVVQTCSMAGLAGAGGYLIWWITARLYPAWQRQLNGLVASNHELLEQSAGERVKFMSVLDKLADDLAKSIDVIAKDCSEVKELLKHGPRRDN